MNRRERQERLLHEICIFLGMLALLALICRIWVAVFISMVGVIVIALIWVITVPKSEGVIAPSSSASNQPVSKELSKEEFIDYAYSVIQTRITERILTEYPEAKWVWEKPNAKTLIENGEEIFVILSGAAGYRRAKVNIRGFCVKSLEYMTAQVPIETSDCGGFPPRDDTDTDPSAQNYELLAFEWSEAHAVELNRRCNEVIGTGGDHLLLTAEELPLRDAWSCLCLELERAGLHDIFCTENGIQINFTQEIAERE